MYIWSLTCKTFDHDFPFALNSDIKNKIFCFKLKQNLPEYPVQEKHSGWYSLFWDFPVNEVSKNNLFVLFSNFCTSQHGTKEGCKWVPEQQAWRTWQSCARSSTLSTLSTLSSTWTTSSKNLTKLYETAKIKIAKMKIQLLHTVEGWVGLTS